MELYQKDVSEKLTKIKARINSYEALTQNEIIEYLNLIAYDLHRSKDEEIKKIVEKLFQACVRYLDLTEDDFVSSFPGNYKQRFFELVMANFFANNFGLSERDDVETMEFNFVMNNNRYAVECVTRTAGQMDRFYELLHFSEELNKAIDNESDKNELNMRLKNLYAILIDTTSYNWLPEIAKSRYGAVFSDKISNYYGIIYNKNMASKWNPYVDQRIFDDITPFAIELALGSFIKIEDSLIES